MPYENKYPKSIDNLPKEAKEIWMSAFNNAIKKEDEEKNKSYLGEMIEGRDELGGVVPGRGGVRSLLAELGVFGV